MLDSSIAKVHSRVPEIVRWTQRLVEVNSYTQNVEGVNAVGELLREAFDLPGLQFRREAGGPGCGDHLFWTSAAGERAAPLLLIGHHDTVFPPGHFEAWREEAGRVHGPGCLDMKGGLAMIRAVVATLSEADRLRELPLCIACVADEETGSLDSKRHLERVAQRASGALVFEAGRARDAIITRRRGVGTVRAIATGKAAHSGNAHADGANAIWALARFIEAAQSLTDYARGLTLNTGTITGGTSANTVPAGAEAKIDLRFETVADAEALMTQLREAAVRAALPGTEIQLEGGIKRLPMERTEASRRLFEAYAQCQRDAGLGDGEHALVGGGSDANTVAGVGLPAIDGLGPRGSGVHTLNEVMEIDSLGPKAEALLRFLWRAVAKT